MCTKHAIEKLGFKKTINGNLPLSFRSSEIYDKRDCLFPRHNYNVRCRENEQAYHLCHR